MIHILLLILKIIGIILLVILCLALLILFFPITYVGNINVKNKSICGKIRAGWLFHIVHFGMKFEQTDVSYALRVLGIPVVSSKKRQKEDASEKKDTEINVIKEKKKHTDVEDERQTVVNEEHASKQDSNTDDEISQEDALNVSDSKRTKKTGTDQEEEAVKKKIIDKIKEFLKKIKRKVSNILKNIKGYCEKAKEIKNFITANTTKEAYHYGKKIIMKLAKHILPKKIRGYVRFGFEEPHLTGQTLGYIAMGFSMFHINLKHMVVEPDFENCVLDGNIRFRGRVLLGVAGLYILKLYFKKEIKEIIKKFN